MPQICKDKLSSKTDRLFSKAEQLFYSAFLPLPHPKIVISDKDGVFQGVANFDLGFCIKGRIYLFTFHMGILFEKLNVNLEKNYLKIRINLYTKTYQSQSRVISST